MSQSILQQRSCQKLANISHQDNPHRPSRCRQGSKFLLDMTQAHTQYFQLPKTCQHMLCILIWMRVQSRSRNYRRDTEGTRRRTPISTFQQDRHQSKQQHRRWRLYRTDTHHIFRQLSCLGMFLAGSCGSRRRTNVDQDYSCKRCQRWSLRTT